MGQFLLGLVIFVLGTAYLLAPLFVRETTWQTGGARSPTLIALAMAAGGIWQMLEPIVGDVEGVRTWTLITGVIIALLIGEGWRRRIVRPEDIMRRAGVGPSRDDVAQARFEAKKRKEEKKPSVSLWMKKAPERSRKNQFSRPWPPWLPERRLPRDTKAR